ncbi:beta-xylosidase [Nocardia camponoti]|uniref:Cellulase family glycosylhydrolase n=1 Tax=Nocardia camponoti TaxID=1616106 RepID=A0A917Q7I7_9NOCA|nr:beta-xylosidase [Nocardia camponoti]GGK33533.1 hypothetical protein GCM10011591_01490 [Nocardia camponoti]
MTLWRIARLRGVASFLVAVVAVTVVGCGAPSRSNAAPEIINPTGLGISGGHGWQALSQTELDRQLTIVADTGAKWIRIDLDWSGIEPRRGHQDWADSDRVVNSARAHGLYVLAILTYTPRWAMRDRTGDDKAAPDPALYGQFVADAIERYRSKIRHWEVWNEPNIDTFFRPKPDVGLYAQLLHQAAMAVRVRQPGGQVIVGGLAPAADDGTDIAPTTFLERLYALGAESDFDAVALHPYSYPEPPSVSGRDNAFGNLSRVRAIMDRHGDIGKRVWPTEFGAPTGTASSAVSEETQARIVAEGLGVMATMRGLGPVFVYSLVDAGDDRADQEDNFGMLRRDYSAKPAFAVLRANAKALDVPR